VYVQRLILLPTSWPLGRLGPLALEILLKGRLRTKTHYYSRIIKDIIEVPLPRAASKLLISFFTFQISIFFSASLAWASLILTEVDASSERGLKRFFDDNPDSAVFSVEKPFFLYFSPSFFAGMQRL
jgi:hypothetical protein